MENEYLVTHVFNRPSDRGWIKMAYVVKKGEKYYIGEKSNRGLLETQLEGLIEDRALITLKDPIKKTLNQNLWLTPKNEMYLASKENPIGDLNKKFVERLTY